jgi:hypothetical protein
MFPPDNNGGQNTRRKVFVGGTSWLGRFDMNTARHGQRRCGHFSPRDRC